MVAFFEDHPQDRTMKMENMVVEIIIIVIVMNTLMEVTRMTWAVHPMVVASAEEALLADKPKENRLPHLKIFKDCNQ